MLSKQETRRKRILDAKFTEEEWGRVAPFLDEINHPVNIDDPLNMLRCLDEDTILASIVMDILDERIDKFF